MVEITVWKIIFLVFFSGLISVDRLAGLNIMLSRPVVISGIVGFLFGNVILALMFGIIFEFIGMLEVPVGTTVVHDDSFGGYVSSIIFASQLIQVNYINILALIFVTALLIFPVTYTDKFYRKINKNFLDKSISRHEKNYERKLIKFGLLLAFLRGILTYNIGLFIVYGVLRLVNLYSLDSIKTYDISIAFAIIIIFMGVYLLHFLIVRNVFKLIILSFGILFGWLIL